ncbi:GLUG motif-containing protein [Parabacteroides sp.]
MKQTLQCILSRLLLLVCMAVVPAVSWGQDNWLDEAVTDWYTNTTGDIYEISNAAQLAGIAKLVNEGTETFNGKTIKLTADIDLGGKEWTPIGYYSDKYFQGNFDGQKHVIRNLSITYKSEQYAGLFGVVGDGTSSSGLNITIENLGVTISETGIHGWSSAGGIVGAANGVTLVIQNCYVTGGLITAYMPGSDSASSGGIFGAAAYNDYGSTKKITIQYCYSSVSCLSAQADGNPLDVYLGGIAAGGGGVKLTISHCLSLSTHFIAIRLGEMGSFSIGNIVGYSGNTTIENNYSTPISILTKEDRHNSSITTTVPTENTNANNEVSGTFLTNANIATAFTGWDTDIWEIDNLNLPTFKGDNITPQTLISDYMLEGTGDPADPYLLSSEPLLIWMAEMLNKSDKYNDFKSKSYKLTKDITLTKEWTPIGTDSKTFGGQFDGNHKCISNLSIRKDYDYAGFFGYTDGATIKDIGIKTADEGINITAQYLGGLVGHAYDTNISGCYIIGGELKSKQTSGNCSIGGIAGTFAGNAPTINNCYSAIDITGNSADATVGGLVGNIEGDISYCYAAGKINNVDGNTKTGGIAGKLNDSHQLSQCIALNISDIPANGGRLCSGVTTPTFSNCYASPLATINGQSVADGALDNKDGLDLTATNFTDDADGCFNGWDGSIWDFRDGTLLPKLQNFTAEQPDLEKLNYLSFNVTLTQPAEGGTLEVSYGTNQKLNNGVNKLPGNTVLTINPKQADGYRPKEIQVGGMVITGYSHKVIADTEITAVFEKIPDPVIPDPAPEPDPTPDPTPVFYTVTLPAVDGVVSDPVPGQYEVESWDSFRFYLTLDKDYDQSVPVLTTDRGETLEPRSSDGAYVIKYVRSDVEIFIDGIMKNPDPVANETIQSGQSKVWTDKDRLYIEPAITDKAYIYTAGGSLEVVRSLNAGEIQTVQLPAGIYLVRIGNERFKVRL